MYFLIATNIVILLLVLFSFFRLRYLLISHYNLTAIRIDRFESDFDVYAKDSIRCDNLTFNAVKRMEPKLSAIKERMIMEASRD